MSEPTELIAHTEQVEPIIVHQGRYRLWRKPDGGLHLVYQRDDADEPDHLELPGQMVQVFDAAASGKMSPVELVKVVMTMMKNGPM